MIELDILVLTVVTSTISAKSSMKLASFLDAEIGEGSSFRAVAPMYVHDFVYVFKIIMIND